MVSHRRHRAAGLTLLELVVIVAVLVALALLVLPRLDTIKDTSALQGTRTTLNAIRDAITGSSGIDGYQQNMNGFPRTLRDLYLPPVAPTGTQVYDPITRHGWHGPYLSDALGTYAVSSPNGFTADYGTAGDPAPVDAWNHPIILQYPSDAVTTDPTQKRLFARLVSAGPDGVIQTPETVLYPTPAQRGDDVILFLMRPDVAP